MLSSMRSKTPPPRSPATGVPSRSTSHQQSPRSSSGTEASKGPASASPSGSSASCPPRSNQATTRAANRQNCQVPEYNKTARLRWLVATSSDDVIVLAPISFAFLASKRSTGIGVTEAHAAVEHSCRLSAIGPDRADHPGAIWTQVTPPQKAQKGPAARRRAPRSIINSALQREPRRPEWFA